MTKTETKKTSFLGNLTVQIVIAMLLGAFLGIYVHNNYDVTFAKEFSDKIKILATVFIRLVQMIIAVLVFSTLVPGIAKLGDIKTVGRVGGKALGWFFSASFISLLIGLFWVNVLKPGVGLNLSNIDLSTAAEVTGNTQSFSTQNFIEHIIPKSIVEAMANNEIIQIVIFSIFFGLAAASIGNYAKPVIHAIEVLSHIVLKMVNYVMKFAPMGVFGAIAGVFAVKDLNELVFTYIKFFASFLVGISSLWVFLLAVGFIFLGKRMKTLLNHIVGPLIIAFSTTSSEAVFPKLTEELERFGIKDKIVAFMLPLGYSFNLDGSMMYMTFASLFIAQAYGIDLDMGTQMTMLLVLMLTSKGIAGVPRASLVIVAATCGMFKIPIEGIALILPIDHFCDMFRSATNVLGNALATSVVGKWEGEDSV
ncbi:cation:dicarboxylase symporter family transporter [Flavobacterium franklandianum]|uniref:Cation:dicarboxylase symporter family transporter n=1 Tax=Flavobacterium franklandianum TaxID=2594430 RepID=A0A553CM78_9FLAO|nr:cation:dicarboxylase symporter family transporter [Flavobacterium franklandianum]TRX21557.1 cation:dicarboxylase symporter family transporter [Flavobacterium franklandianum]TRX22454.1 cation:dicarboxylase symporter family transporter [Flavobacterium franklandianum]